MLPGLEAPRLYLVDGTAQLFRAYHAISGLTSPTGLPTNAIYGFTSMLRKLIRDERPPYLAVAFDLGGAVFRHAAYAEYKAHRPPTPEDLDVQAPYARRVCQALRVATLELAGYEADDLIATGARQAREAGFDVVIVAADKDLLQLVGPGVVVLNPTSGARLDAAGVARSFGVAPERVPDVLGLMGDAVDNVPGVPGVGHKTAVAAVAAYGSLEAVLERAGRLAAALAARDELLAALEREVSSEEGAAAAHAFVAALELWAALEGDQDWRTRLAGAREALVGIDDWTLRPRERASLRRLLKDLDRGSARRVWQAMVDHAAQARLSRELAVLDARAPVELDPRSFAVGAPDADRARELFEELGFRSLREEFGGAGAASPAGPAVAVETVTDSGRLAEVAAACRAAGQLALAVVADGKDPLRADPTALALACRAGEAFFVPLDPAAGPAPPASALREALGPLLSDPGLARYGADTKRVGHLLRARGLETGAFRLDAEVAAYLLDADRSAHGVTALAREHLGREPTGDPPAGAEAAALLDLAAALRSRLADEGLLALYERIDGPLLPVLAEMEAAGVGLDTAVLARMSGELETALAALRGELRDLAGVDFNPDSPKQLRDVLFDRLGLRPRRRTAKAGAASTDAATLEELVGEHPIAGRLLEYRELAKLKGTYVDALPRLVHPGTGRVHTRFDPTGAATGRLSSIEPNLQNIPTRTEVGRRVRAAFVPRPGWVFLASDYSQIELRVLAHLSQDAELIAAFRAGEDVHRRTAARVFDVAPDLVTDDLRQRAKAINFGVLYGMSELRLAREQGLSRSDARRFIAAYFGRFAGVARYIEDVRERAAATGVVHTLFGRRRTFPELRARGARVLREQALRAAVNTTVQGTAADLMKLSMLDVRRELAAAALPARMLLQVHDELLLEVEPGVVEPVAALVRRAMEHVHLLEVPLVVDSRVGQNWLEVS